MPIVYDKLLALALPDVHQTYTARYSMLYALGVGLGQDPTDERALAFVYDKGLQALPTMVCVLGHDPFWIRDLDTGIDYTKVVHGEQSFRLHQPLKPSGRIVGRTRIRDVIDKGAGKGAVLSSERTVLDADTGEPIATVLHTTFCRADGGFGGPQRAGAPPVAPPARSPDLVCDLPTRPEAALIYRLSGDYNPLHAEPGAALAAGYPRPILHGLATFGVAGHAILRAVCDYDAARLVAMGGRFTAPVFPGETIRTEIWRDGSALSFRVRVAERDAIVIANGRAELAA